jgi:hypothetical protein
MEVDVTFVDEVQLGAESTFDAASPAGRALSRRIGGLRLLFALVTVLASLAVAGPVYAWPMCGC